MFLFLIALFLLILGTRYFSLKELVQTDSPHLDIIDIDLNTKSIEKRKVILSIYDNDSKQFQLSFKAIKDRQKENFILEDGNGNKIMPTIIYSSFLGRKYTSFIYDLKEIPKELFIYSGDKKTKIL